MLDKVILENALHELEVYTQKEDQLYKIGLDITEITNGIIDTLFNILKEETNDDTDLIFYFCFELNFGKNWAPGMITDEDGADVPLRTVDELYDILLKDEEECNSTN